jgi:hypothetical protein
MKKIIFCLLMLTCVIAMNSCKDKDDDNNDNNNTNSVSGCTDPTATNYNSAATVDDGTCTYPATATFTIGQDTLGGIVFYINGTGQHGLIAATSDQSASCQWGCMATTIPGANDSAVGTGQANTTAIVGTCTTTGIAAQICNALVTGGYSDWFLPSKLELSLMYTNKTAIGGFTTYGYWSSTQHGSGTAWVEYFSNGLKATANKNDAYHLRAVRAF